MENEKVYDRKMISEQVFKQHSYYDEDVKIGYNVCSTNYKSYGKIILKKFYEILVNQNKTFYFFISIYIMKGN